MGALKLYKIIGGQRASCNKVHVMYPRPEGPMRGHVDTLYEAVSWEHMFLHV